MERELRDRWIVALRSGNYKQGNGYLCQTEGPDTLYCCLGVLCNIQAVEFSPIEYEGYQKEYLTSRLGEEMLIDEGKEFGLTPLQHEILYNLNDGMIGQSRAIKLGIEDKEHTFEEIADWIENNL